jgi:hypothetical protein
MGGVQLVIRTPSPVGHSGARLCSARVNLTKSHATLSHRDVRGQGMSSPLANWKRPFWPLVLLLFLILLIAGLPVISVAISMAIANGLGCTLNEGNIHPCPFIGTDLGHLLYFFSSRAGSDF